jgi:ribonuclease P protein component
MGNSLCRDEKLLKRAEFVFLSASGNKLHTPHFLILWSLSRAESARLGVTASRKVGSAVIRNRIKRLLREYFRLHKAQFIVADFNIIAKRGAESLSLRDVCQELDKAVCHIRNQKCSSGC